MDLLHHEVLESALFGRSCIPVDLSGSLLDDVAVEVIESNTACFEASHLKVVDVINGSCVLEDSGNVGCEI